MFGHVAFYFWIKPKNIWSSDSPFLTHIAYTKLKLTETYFIANIPLMGKTKKLLLEMWPLGGVRLNCTRLQMNTVALVMWNDWEGSFIHFVF